MMRGLTVSQRIAASFALVIAVMLGMSATFYLRAVANHAQATEVLSSDLAGMSIAAAMRLKMTDHLLQVQELVKTARANEGRKAELPAEAKARLAALESGVDKSYAEYQPTVYTPADREATAEFARTREEYQQKARQVLELLAQGQVARAEQLASEQVAPLWNKNREQLSVIIDLNQRQVTQAMQEMQETATSNQRLSVGALVLALVLAAVSGLLLHRSILRPIEGTLAAMKTLGNGDLSSRLNLGRSDEFNAIEQGFNGMAASLRELVVQAQRSSVQLTTSITEVAATAKQQQATVTETAATTSEIGATSRQISATSRELVRTMGEVSARSEQTAALAGSGHSGVLRMAEVMQQLTSAAEMVNAKLALLNEKAGGINQVVTTIVKVADQTNLLSLNAAIEAEKAGEYGRGFGVVATEVRRLADQTAIATYDIEQMVREIQSAVSAGVMGMDKFSEEVRRGNAEMAQVGDQLSQIIHQVQALAPQVQLASEGMQAQSGGAEQIEQALSQLTEASGQTVESLRQTGMAIEDMSDVANNLRSGVSRFKV
ncbi:methyl-accepting chemotaxis protein WspA [Acidovorax soli]|uniref:Methyl-accepting chemotaxis protein WspA n=1 Tax=Acidovorax soli TaxID=592050 RepID=A0A7X0PHS6_9BURK|nr:methyl-accepting chemotaxis protein [Acidovorax soli]MBB6562227.1 methyl-accepting chemotaxis protein WspA [Acidovorax soli]